MKTNLIPRFYYTLSFFTYFKGLFLKKQDSNFLFRSKYDNNILHFNHARTGLRTLLSSISNEKLNIGIQVYTCHTVFQAIRKAGHNIVFIDLTDDFKLDITDIKHKIKDIDVLIVSHTFGLPDNFNLIKKIVGNKIIIEDCAHSFLSKYKEKYTGTLGDSAIFSTGLGKFPAVGAGGFILVNNLNKFPLLDNEFKKITKFKLLNSLKDFIKTLILSIMMKPPLYGLITYKLGKALDKKMDFGNKFSFKEYKANSWSEKVLKNNQPLFDKILLKQQQNAKKLSSLLNNSVQFNNMEDSSSPNYYVFPILTQKRDLLYNKLLSNGIEAGKHFQNSIVWAKEFGYQEGECPNTESIIERIITVPIHFGVTKNDLHKIATIINKYAK